ncbi:MAG TPA: DUF3817 domain-containing protein [Alcaligenes sp.]|nr:DUF3817 domain-containing protein [Alcaligenes faecalis]HRL20282.1 DUF3817 domain-containing protein [Alcaligenes sp.]
MSTIALLDRQARQGRRLRLLALLEGCSLLALLFLAMPLKHLAGISFASALIGPVHGLLFMSYLWAVFYSAGLFGWSLPYAVRIAWPALIPFGTLLLWRTLRQSTRP